MRIDRTPIVVRLKEAPCAHKLAIALAAVASRRRHRDLRVRQARRQRLRLRCRRRSRCSAARSAAASPRPPPPPHLAGSRIAAAGDGALVIDADSGSLIRTDKTGTKLGEIAIGKQRRPARLRRRRRHRLRRRSRGRPDRRRCTCRTTKRTLEVGQTWKTPAEPYGVALSPDAKTLLVTTIADRTLVALRRRRPAPRAGAPALGREPRGVAVSPDGTRALVAYLATGTVDQIDLLETHHAEHIALVHAGSGATLSPLRQRR